MPRLSSTVNPFPFRVRNNRTRDAREETKASITKSLSPLHTLVNVFTRNSDSSALQHIRVDTGSGCRTYVSSTSIGGVETFNLWASPLLRGSSVVVVVFLPECTRAYSGSGSCILQVASRRRPVARSEPPSGSSSSLLLLLQVRWKNNYTQIKSNKKICPASPPSPPPPASPKEKNLVSRLARE